MYDQHIFLLKYLFCLIRNTARPAKRFLIVTYIDSMTALHKGKQVSALQLFLLTVSYGQLTFFFVGNFAAC